MFFAGGVGGVIQGGKLKSKNRVMLLCAASLFLSAAKLKHTSISFRMAVKSATLWLTKCFLE